MSQIYVAAEACWTIGAINSTNGMNRFMCNSYAIAAIVADLEFGGLRWKYAAKLECQKEM